MGRTASNPSGPPTAPPRGPALGRDSQGAAEPGCEVPGPRVWSDLGRRRGQPGKGGAGGAALRVHPRPKVATLQPLPPTSQSPEQPGSGAGCGLPWRSSRPSWGGWASQGAQAAVLPQGRLPPTSCGHLLQSSGLAGSRRGRPQPAGRVGTAHACLHPHPQGFLWVLGPSSWEKPRPRGFKALPLPAPKC